MLSIILISVTVLTAQIMRRFWLNNILAPAMPPIIRISAAVIALGMIILIPMGIDSIKSSLADRNWPTTTGIVTESKIGEGRAYRPEVQYRYSVDGKEYSGTSHLHAPGFGGKNQRYDTAKKLLENYVVGKEIAVHYNPNHHAESLLVAAVRWDTYAKPGFYTVMLLIASTLIFNGRSPSHN